MSKIELVSRGDLDVYLTGNPSITFFKTVYRKHTNFSMEDIIIGAVNKPASGNRYAIRVPIRTGDLLYKTELILKGNRVYCGGGVANISTAVLDNIIFSIGSREIDRTYGHYLETWYELNQENPNNTVTNVARIEDSSLYHIGQIADQAVLAAMKCNGSYNYIDNNLAKPTLLMGSGLSYPATQFQRTSKSGGTFCTPNYLNDHKYKNNSLSGEYPLTNTVNNRPINAKKVDELNGSNTMFGHNSASKSSASLVSSSLSASLVEKKDDKGDIIGDCILPLNFWFCRSPGLSIPLIALSNGVDVEIFIQFASSGDAHWTQTTDTTDGGDGIITYDTFSAGINDINNVYCSNNKSSNTVNSYRNKSVPILNNSNFNFDLNISSTYIFLDDMERRRFKSSSHEYLIEQLQFQQFVRGSANQSQSTLDISSFHHPVKELIWTGTPYKKSNIDFVTNIPSEQQKIDSLNNGTYAHSSGIRYVTGIYDVLYGGGVFTKTDGVTSTTPQYNTSYTSGFGNGSYEFNSRYIPKVDDSLNLSGKYVQGLLGPSTPDVLNYCNYKLVLNGNDRIEYKPLQYFTRQTLHKYHKGGCVSVPDSIAVYSFALDPTNIEPTGTCNFSNIESIEIMRDLPSGGFSKGVNVYAINYNILRFVNGQAGLMYVL